MRLIIFLIAACLRFQYACAEEMPVHCTFFTLESIQKGNEVEISNGATIQIRGFLYQADDSKTILAAEPNLKSCCVGSTSKRHKQLLVDGDVHAAINSAAAVTLQGNLMINFNDPFPFKLQNGSIVAEKGHSYVSVALVMLSLATIFCITHKLHRRQ